MVLIASVIKNPHKIEYCRHTYFINSYGYPLYDHSTIPNIFSNTIPVTSSTAEAMNVTTKKYSTYVQPCVKIRQGRERELQRSNRRLNLPVRGIPTAKYTTSITLPYTVQSGMVKYPLSIGFLSRTNHNVSIVQPKKDTIKNKSIRSNIFRVLLLFSGAALLIVFNKTPSRYNELDGTRLF